MKKTVISLWTMMRPLVGFISGAGAIITYLSARPDADILKTFCLGVAFFAMSSGGFIINDYFDVEKDSINDPKRPIPSGRIKPTTALWAAEFFFFVSLVAAVPFIGNVFPLILLNVVLLCTYSYILLWNGVFGNIVTAYLASSVVFLSGLAGGAISMFLPAIAFIFALVFVREIVFDIEDIEGDRAVGMCTLAIVYGPERVFRLAWTTIGCMLIATFMASTLGISERSGPFFWFAVLALLPVATGLLLYEHRRSKTYYRVFKLLGCLSFVLCSLILTSGR